MEDDPDVPELSLLLGDTDGLADMDEPDDPDASGDFGDFGDAEGSVDLEDLDDSDNSGDSGVFVASGPDDAPSAGAVPVAADPEPAFRPARRPQVGQAVMPWAARTFSAILICWERLAWSALDA
ncbi:hypothetical protein [Streptomyces sp. NPDC006134]|uniref:hypothetical protein n=1 Tax=Streptomyces sp. NPDC006134 TaxID=3154467 RepID=UPI0033D14F09